VVGGGRRGSGRLRGEEAGEEVVAINWWRRRALNLGLVAASATGAR